MTVNGTDVDSINTREEVIIINFGNVVKRQRAGLLSVNRVPQIKVCQLL